MATPGSRAALARAFSIAFSTKLSRSAPGTSRSEAMCASRAMPAPERRRCVSAHHARADTGSSTVSVAGERSFSSVAWSRRVSWGSWRCSRLAYASWSWRGPMEVSA